MTKVENKRNISVDIGNTRIKTGLFDRSQLIETRSFDDLSALSKYCLATAHSRIGIVSVGKNQIEVQDAMADLNPLFITIDSALPVQIDYKTPETLGIDRLVACIGGFAKYPNENILVIDMGSCITYDLLKKDGTYVGGVISPGLKMRMRAMSSFTQNLPDIREDWQSHLAQSIGKSTRECMTQGTHQAIIHEIEGFIREFRREFDQLTVILTGGDGSSFESKVKEPIFADSFLVLRGIDTILNQE